MGTMKFFADSKRWSLLVAQFQDGPSRGAALPSAEPPYVKQTKSVNPGSDT